MLNQVRRNPSSNRYPWRIGKDGEGGEGDAEEEEDAEAETIRLGLAFNRMANADASGKAGAPFAP